jgi:hypothetical protein
MHFVQGLEQAHLSALYGRGIATGLELSATSDGNPDQDRHWHGG